jgi:hypothetical protein
MPAAAAAQASSSEAAQTFSRCLYVGAAPSDLAGCFTWEPYGEVLTVSDHRADGWSILVELWINGRLSRTCWDTNGASNGSVTCNFEIAEGTRIDFYIAQAKYSTCTSYSPSLGCDKGRWAGPFVGYA